MTRPGECNFFNHQGYYRRYSCEEKPHARCGWRSQPNWFSEEARERYHQRPNMYGQSFPMFWQYPTDMRNQRRQENGFGSILGLAGAFLLGSKIAKAGGLKPFMQNIGNFLNKLFGSKEVTTDNSNMKKEVKTDAASVTSKPEVTAPPNNKSISAPDESTDKTVVTGKSPDECTDEAVVTGKAFDECTDEAVVTGKSPDECTDEAVVTGKSPDECTDETVFTGKAPDECADEAVVTGKAPDECRDEEVAPGKPLVTPLITADSFQSIISNYTTDYQKMGTEAFKSGNFEEFMVPFDTSESTPNPDVKTEYSTMDSFFKTYSKGDKVDAKGIRQMHADFKAKGIKEITIGGEKYNIINSEDEPVAVKGTSGNDIIFLSNHTTYYKSQGNDLYLSGSGLIKTIATE